MPRLHFQSFCWRYFWRWRVVPALKCDYLACADHMDSVRPHRARRGTESEAKGLRGLARIAGCSPTTIMVRHLLPNVTNTIMVLISLNVGWAILVEASLGFLGAGLPPGTASWGAMINDGRQWLLTAWWISTFPGIVLALTVLAFNLFGDWMRDALDPKLRQL